MSPHLPCAAVDRAWRRGGSRRINCQASQCRSRLRVWIRPSLVKSIYSRVRTEPDLSVRHVRRLCGSYIFLNIEHIAVVRLQNQSYLSCFIRSSINQKTAAKKAKLYEAASERSSLKHSEKQSWQTAGLCRIHVLCAIQVALSKNNSTGYQRGSQQRWRFGNPLTQVSLRDKREFSWTYWRQ